MKNAIPKSEMLEQLRQNISEIESQGRNSNKEVRGSESNKTNSLSEPNAENEANNDAFKKIQRLINCREHSKKSLFKRLVRDGFSEQASNAAVNRACECGLVSDARFAEVLVSSRLAQGYGIGAIERELCDNGIDPQSCTAFCELSETSSSASEIQRALEFMSKRPSRSKNPRQAAYRKLVSRGYGTHVASAAAKKWEEQL